ncbi:MAG: AhpC/TSA family protein [Bacteroidaceae bacterium]|nr:AhpC/TSA family protein [Bacteroidaceae bacterium]
MKKFSLFMVLAGMLMSVSAQDYTITGVAPQGENSVYLRNLSTDVVDSAEVGEKGEFSFSGNAAGKHFAAVILGSDVQQQMLVFLEGNVKVDMVNKDVTGNTENEGLNAWQKKEKAMAGVIQEKMKRLSEYQQNGQEPPAELVEDLRATYTKVTGDLGAEAKVVLADNTDKRYPAYVLASMYSLVDQDFVVDLQQRNPVYMQEELAQGVVKQIEGWKRQQVGKMFTDIEMADTAGVMHKLSEYVGKGNYVLIDFWASWCGPCMKEVPNVIAAYEKYHPKGFDIVGLSLDNSADAWKGAIVRKQLPWHNLSDLQGWKNEAAQLYGVTAIPQTLLIAPDGTIAANGLHGEGLKEKLAEIYGE